MCAFNQECYHLAPLLPFGNGDLAMDLLEGLRSFQFESETEDENYPWLYLKGRCRGLMIEGCAHAVFFCKLIQNLREQVREQESPKYTWAASSEEQPEDKDLKLGIIGGGHLGKQLALTLLQLVPVAAENLRISTRRPETLEAFQKLGIHCFYRNTALVQWADVIFLCCLPSQLPNICVEIQTLLAKECIVYSFVAAVPISRLKILLNHTNILRPQYRCTKEFEDLWGANEDIVTSLRNPGIIQATCPYNPAGGITLSSKWLEGIVYAVLNICTSRGMPTSHALLLVNKVFLTSHFADCGKDRQACPKLQLLYFVNKIYARNVSPRRPFPWFELTTIQHKENPFTQCLSGSTALQEHLTWRYCDLLGIPLTREHLPECSPGS
ncbi:NADP-dependent oxidoreductase domain-containing protein 1 isoform X2 [Erinaceus europaeus]|uniref:NADP-dependent oxidoreductase domain-containing protein 1 isoform X2 n=1 Tax=Erinaceus europaeus TaxID=9365 RepID=A0ABM3WL72_ERIEU|nr:NADP-dependent oxidoreductase domain-containing protein 1 isoform X2 [Erinaceus europaeus]